MKIRTLVMSQYAQYAVATLTMAAAGIAGAQALAVPKAGFCVVECNTVNAGAPAAAPTPAPASAQTTVSGNVKVTVLYGNPANAEEFEKHYLGTHMPLVKALKGVRRIEVAKSEPRRDGAAPPFIRITEFWFDSAEQMAAVTASPEWARIGEDFLKFANGGLTVVVSKVE